MKINKINKLPATMSLDLDNQWAYMKTHRDTGWQEYPSYLDRFIPYVLDKLNRLHVKATFFIVGKDACIEKNIEYLKAVADDRHEVANHSFYHEPYSHQYGKDQLHKEIVDSHEAISLATGITPVGFRGPGFTYSENLLLLLEELGYCYDATVFPTFLGPILRKYFFASSKLTESEQLELSELYGKFNNGFKPNIPFFWELSSGGKLLEIPVSTMPLLRIPIHMTYLMFLASYSAKIMFYYLDMVIGLFRLTSQQPSFLVHPLDLMGEDMVPELSYFPGMKLHTSYKAELFSRIVERLTNKFTLVTMSECFEVAQEKEKTR